MWEGYWFILPYLHSSWSVLRCGAARDVGRVLVYPALLAFLVVGVEVWGREGCGKGTGLSCPPASLVAEDVWRP
ncbi:hypothetical protein RR46_03937 [Papilio xuthus]|uniref:Uncharacterized protein n=1 Tax=Papilio xuthus TaxID=66420 RepID=A0A194Q1W9_PAPXU|nr:hypothetical protein RR46_03937 [Papilio xuthus]